MLTVQYFLVSNLFTYSTSILNYYPFVTGDIPMNDRIFEPADNITVHVI